jgi:electron transport complex protein RnfB
VSDLAALTERLDRLLPQTQCGQCGFAGCRPYAQAMASGEADVDRCPPGGDAGARALAHVLGVQARPFDRTRGAHKPPQAAVVVEADCIGCTKCIQACPVDAIIGAAKHMHTVIEPLCTGCELCIPACPVDCIILVPAGDYSEPAASDLARQRPGPA